MDNLEDDGDPTLSIDQKVAIVGIGCRFPSHIKNVHDFWELLASGKSSVREHPKERLDPSFIYPDGSIRGKIYTRAAGYLSQNIIDFDRNFFKISPEEANHMDPQLRLILEVAWESLEDYGVNVASLRKSYTGVYIGVTAREYSILVGNPEENISQYTASGNNNNMMSNRISYEFDFQGPSMSFDTACSSSLYAIHHACEAIRHGTCDLALAGGVNLMQMPSTNVMLCQARMVSEDGKCKPFDRSADGYGRGEGAGVVVLKPLKKAIEDRDRIYAVIRGGALNNDGKTRGIATPSAESQMRLLKYAYEVSNVNPQEVTYIEAHGTGTQAGDTAEATALINSLGKCRGKGDPPLIVGSVKSNFGHTEAAAGVAGLIKSALVLQKRQIPKLVNFQSRNENINWSNCQMIFPTELLEWPKGSKYLAGCSSFGFGGANAHLVLEAAPGVDKPLHSTNCLPTLLLLSAATKDALDQRISEWLVFLKDSTDYDFRDIVHTAALRSTHYSYRLALPCESLDQSLNALMNRQSSAEDVKNTVVEGLVQVIPANQSQKLVFVFSGMGTQWWGMGRHLIQTDGVFRKVIDEADRLLQEFGATWSLQSLLTTETDIEKIHNTEVTQPSLCALQIALAEVYRHFGILPHAVIGHSLGEIAAACVGGYLTFRDAMKLVFIRAKLLNRTTGKGSMAVIFLQAKDIREKLSSPEYKGKVEIACVNSQSETVISGNTDALFSLVDYFESQGIRCVFLKVKNAFHSFQQEEVKESFLAQTAFLQTPTNYGCNKYSPRQVPMVSTVTGEFLTAKDLNSNQYWWQNLRQSVEFERSLKRLSACGYSVFLEISPHPSMAPTVRTILKSASDSPDAFYHPNYAVTESLIRPADQSQLPNDKINILMSIAKLYVQGYPLDLEMIFSNEPFQVISLPTYPWQRQQCDGVSQVAKDTYLTPRGKHPLIGKPLALFGDESGRVEMKIWHSSYSLKELPWLPHHKIENTVILPGATFIEMMLAVAETFCERNYFVTLENVSFNKVHYPAECEGSFSTTAKKSNQSSKWHVNISTCSDNNEVWAENATCDMMVNSTHHSLPGEDYLDSQKIAERCRFQITSEQFYKKLVKYGIQVGNLFGCITKACYNTEKPEALVYASLPTAITNESDVFIFHPALLDSIFQLFMGFSELKQTPLFETRIEIPSYVGSVNVRGKSPGKIIIHLSTIVEDSNEIVQVRIANSDDNKVFAMLRNIKFKTIVSESKRKGVQVWHKEWVLLAGDGNTSTNNETDVTLVNDTVDYLVTSGQNDKTEIFVNSLRRQSRIAKTMHICDISKHDDVRTFKNEVKTVQNVIVLTYFNDAYSGSINQISKEQFSRSQVDVVLPFIDIITSLTEKLHRDDSKVWIVTKGAVLASPCDASINPLMAPGYALALTFMHEFPDLAVATLDLPQEQSTEKSADWLAAFFNRPVRLEGCLAFRSYQGDTADVEPEFCLFSLRLKSQSTFELSIHTKSNEWMMSLKECDVNSRLKVADLSNKIAVNHKETVQDNSMVSLRIEVFMKQNHKSLSYSKSEVGFLFGGEILQNSDSSSRFTPGSKVMAYSKSHLVSTTVESHCSELVLLPSNVGVIEAVAVVQTCFPFYLALQDAFKLSNNPSVLLASTNTKMHLKFANRLAHCKNLRVFLYVENKDAISGLKSECEKVKVISSQSIYNDLGEDFVDSLVLHPDIKLTTKEAEMLFSKVQFHGTITVLGAGEPIKSNIITSRQIAVRYTDLEFMWSPENSVLTNQLTDSLLQLFFGTDAKPESINHLIETAAIDDELDENLDGKILLPKPSVTLPCRYDNIDQLFQADPKASYLVVGGTKGLGFEVVRWLVLHGAKCIYISGRNEPNESILEEMICMSGNDVIVKFMKSDISDEQDTKRMLINIQSCADFPLSGIFHCAATFDDRILSQATNKAWQNVLLPKAYGLLLLHQLTIKLKIKLKMFVAISSMTQYMGNFGQGSYCTANTFLASLCQARRLQGLSATVVAPGTISEVGFAARKGFDKLWENRGLGSLSPSEFIKSLSWSLVTETSELGLTGEIDQKSFLNVQLKVFEKTNLYSIFKKEFPPEVLSAVSNPSSNQLASLNPTEATAMIDEFLCDFLRDRMGVSEIVSSEVSLNSFGFDSSMSWELSGLISSKFSVAISSVELLNDTIKISDIRSIIYQRARCSGPNEQVQVRESIVKPNTLWLREPYHVKFTARADVVCFSYTGKGATMFADWAEMFARKDIRVVVAQLPGWEGRENEPASHDLNYLVQEISTAIMRTPKSARVGFFGCGIGSLLAFEVARHLQIEHEEPISHIYICGWYAPSTPPHVTAELNTLITQPGVDNTGDSMDLTFLDNRDLKQIHTSRKALSNVKASKFISSNYRYVKLQPLHCNMTVFSGERDTILSQDVMNNWKCEIDQNQEYENVAVLSDYKLFRNRECNTKIANHVIRSILKE